MAAEPNRERLAELSAEVARFYVRDRRLLRAQERFSRVLAAAHPVPEREVRRYLAAVRRYFDGFAREAKAHLVDVDGRLNKVSQLQFNLTAERGVAARRVELTETVLAHLREAAGE